MKSYHNDIIFQNINKNTKKVKTPSIKYKFNFISLISPFLLKDLRLLTISSSPTTLNKSTALMKQSYLLFTWFYYLKKSKTTDGLKTDNKIKFSFLPVKRTLYTLIKAPMAHKTNSKEQLVFRFFRFTCSIKTYFIFDKIPQTINNGLLTLFLIKKTFPIFETNLLLLKSYIIKLTLLDKNYFNLFFFLKKF